jgi:hypothetical protein
MYRHAGAAEQRLQTHITERDGGLVVFRGAVPHALPSFPMPRYCPAPAAPGPLSVFVSRTNFLAAMASASGPRRDRREPSQMRAMVSCVFFRWG